MDSRMTLGDAAWAFLRAFFFLLKQVFVSLFEFVDAAVARRNRERIAEGEASGHGVGQLREVKREPEHHQLEHHQLEHSAGPHCIACATPPKGICPNCDDFWFNPCPARVAEEVAKSKKSVQGNQGKKYYGVRKGTKPGLYTTWKECEEVVKYYPGAEFKGFMKYSDAVRYLEEQ
ncbi:hypothetical protein M758_10G054000 [Ceratodon purpureus]|nr:hypothetical protein M758_10G054000 [Ceratodon purpureus]